MKADKFAALKEYPLPIQRAMHRLPKPESDLQYLRDPKPPIRPEKNYPLPRERQLGLLENLAAWRGFSFFKRYQNESKLLFPRILIR